MSTGHDVGKSDGGVFNSIISGYKSGYGRIVQFIQENKTKRRAPFLLIIPYLVFMGIFFIIPVLYMFVISFYTNIPAGTMEATLTLENYQTVFSSERYMSTLIRTVRISVIATLLTLVASYPIAYFIVFSGFRYATALILLVVSPLLVGTVVRAFGWFALMAENGLVNQFLNIIGVDYTLLHTETGLIIAIASVLMPFAILILISNLYSLDRDLIQAAKSLGGTPLQTFCYVTLPLSMPGIIAASLISFILTMGTFATAQFVGMPQVPMIAPFIYEAAAKQLNWPLGAALSFVLLAVSLVLISLYSKVMDQGSLGLTQYIARFTGSKSEIGRQRLFLFSNLIGKVRFHKRLGPYSIQSYQLSSMLLTGFLYLLIPVFFALLISFSQGLYIFPPETPTFEWYEGVLNDSQWISSFVTSFQVSFLAMVIALIISFSAAYALGRYDFRGRQLVESATFLPLIIPQVILGIALLVFMHNVGIIGGVLGIAIGLAVYVTPFCIQTLLISMQDYDRSLEEAALSLGADEIQTFRRITVPLLLPGIISAAIFGFILSFANLQIAVFLQGAGTIPIPVRIFASMQFGATPEIAAVAAISILITVVAIAIVERLFGASKALGYTT